MKTFKVGDVVTVKKERTPDMPDHILSSMLRECGGRKYNIIEIRCEGSIYLTDPKRYIWHCTAFEEYDEENTLNIKVSSKYNKITFNFNFKL